MSKLDPTNPLIRQALLKEKLKRTKVDKAQLFNRQKQELTQDQTALLLSKCHPQQRAFLTDESRFKALLCPRRTGKTTATVFETLIHDIRYPGSTIVYIVPDSKAHAKDLFWRPFQEMSTALELNLEFRHVEKRIITPRGTHILLLAAHDRDSPIRLRGSPYSLAILDECKDFGPHFEELIVEAVLPGLGDYGGTLVLAGTPGSVLQGIFYNVTTQLPKGWSVHKWIKSDNTFLRPEERDLDTIEETTYKPFGLDKTSPKFRREQLAEWIADDLERLYQYDPVRNGWDGVLPDEGHEWLYVMGVDFGERDDNAFVVGAFAATSPYLYIIDQYSKSHMSIDEIAAKINEYRALYGEFAEIVGDSGGYGRGIVTDLQNRHNLPIVEADKRGNKLGNIAQMNSDLLKGRIKAKADSPLVKEWYRLSKRYGYDGKVKLDHTDLGDAALYMWRASLHWVAAETPPEPLPGSRDYWINREKHDIMAFVERKQRDWWEV